MFACSTTPTQRLGTKARVACIDETSYSTWYLCMDASISWMLQLLGSCIILLNDWQ